MEQRESSKKDSESEDQGALVCESCGGETYADAVNAAFWGEKGLVAIEDIPARVCKACGEQFYDEETARKIEKVVEDPTSKAKRQIVVPVVSLAEVEDA
jgi:YgiT-type zinc finger domain-containing protein